MGVCEECFIEWLPELDFFLSASLIFDKMWARRRQIKKSYRSLYKSEGVDIKVARKENKKEVVEILIFEKSPKP